MDLINDCCYLKIYFYLICAVCFHREPLHWKENNAWFVHGMQLPQVFTGDQAAAFCRHKYTCAVDRDFHSANIL